MTVGELLTTFPWRASVEIVVQNIVDWEADVYGIPNLPPEIAERTVKKSEVVSYEDYSVLSIYAE